MLEYPEFCNVIAINKDGKFLMERQYRHAQHFTGYEIPDGCVEEGEDPMENEVIRMLKNDKFHQAMMAAPL